MSDVIIAEARAAAARARLNETVGVLQDKLDPATLARQASDIVVGGGQRALSATGAVARRNPAAIAGAVALVGVVLARRQIGRMLFGKRDEPGAPRRVRTHKPPPAKRT